MKNPIGQNSNLVFVYGTLQSGQCNNRVMFPRPTSASLLGAATTLQKFYMAGDGFPRVSKNVLRDFPASMNRMDYFAQVQGELWMVSDESFAACDRLEGHPTFYRREQVPVTLNKGRQRHKAWMYIITNPPEAHACTPKNLLGVLQWECPAWRREHDAAAS